MEQDQRVSQNLMNESNQNRLHEFGYTPEEVKIFSRSSYTAPISALFIRIAAVFVFLTGLYDIIFMPWNNLSSLLTHYLPALFIYILYELSRIYGYKNPEAKFQFMLSLAAILPLMHFTVTAPEQLQQIYLFEAVLLTGLYYIAPGKDISLSLTFSVLVSLFLIGLMLINKVEFSSRWILYLLFYHLLILGGLMVTYLIQGMLNRLGQISSKLSSQNIVYQKLKEEFCNTLDGLSLGILLTNQDGSILVYNHRFQELSGIKELPELNNVAEIMESVCEKERGFYQDIFQGRSEVNAEFQVRRRNDYIWLDYKGLQVYQGKSSQQYLIILEDVTQKKHNQLTRDRQERHLQAVFNPESSIVLYERRKKKLYVTENIKQLLGWSADEFVSGRISYEDLVHEEDKPFIREKYRLWSKSGKQGILYLWYRIRRFDEGIIWLEERLSRIKSKEGEEIITGILIDNTELKTTERQLRQSETSLNRAQEIARLGSWTCMLADGELKASRELFQLLELPDGKLQALKDYEKFIDDKDLEEVRWKISDCLKKKNRKLSLEFGLTTALGNEKIVSAQVEFYWAGTYLLSMEGTLMDITRRKELEQQVFQHQKMEAIGTLAGGIAHDFNNILNIIMGYASVIGEQLPNDSGLWQKFDRINAAASRARNLVTHILTISRQHDSRRHSIKLKALMEEHLELLRAAIPSIIEIEKDLRSESLIYGNPDQIEQVVMNLCTNACYAMEPEGGKLTVRLADDGEMVRLEVADTGSGIPSQVLEKMFDPYFTTKPKGEGTGLGLAIVKGIIDGLNGKIEVNSEKGEGSLFTIWIPRFTGGTETTEELLEEKNEAKQNQEVRVIFIDDEDALVELFEGYLESHGMKVSSFNEGKSALAALDQNPDSWDIMVSDISLPEMDGLEIVRRLRISNKKLPVILYSGFKRPSFLEQARKLGVSSMLIKPVVPEDMLKEIKAVLLEKEIKHD